MATALLIVGYLLAAPPLFVFGRMWRRRWWLAYLAAVSGAFCVAAGWLLHGSLPVAAINAVWAVGFGITFPLFAGRHKRWWVVVSSGLVATLAVGALGYAALRSRFRKTMVSKASTRQAVSDFRRSHGANRLVARRRTPQPGVYEYAATGHYKVTVPGLGEDRRVMPKTVPAVLVSKGDCWELTVRYFKQHHWTVRYCRDPKMGLRLVWLKNTNEIFGLKSDSRSICEPDVILRPGDKPGRQWPQRCRPKDPNPFFGDAKGTAVARYVGAVHMTVGGRKVVAHHLRRSVKITGMLASVVEQNLWYTESGMMVRFHVTAKGSGVARFVADYGLTLMDLSPKR